MLDLHIYLWGGEEARRAGTPYRGTYQTFNLYFTYPPMAAGIFAVLSHLGVPVVQWLMTIASVASLAGAIWLAWGKLGYQRSAGRLGATLAVTAVALWLEPVQQTLAFGQVNLVLMVIIVADLGLPDRFWFKGVGVGLAAGFKLTPLIFIPYLVLTRRYRAAAVATATFGVTIAASFALLPKAAHQFWIDRLFLNSSRTGNVAYVGNQSLYGAALRLAGGANAAHLPWLAAVAVAGAGGLLLAAWLSRRGEEFAAILICALTGLLVSPVSWSHHWVWVALGLVAATELAIRRGATVGPWLRPRAGWLAVAAVLVLYVAYPFHPVPGSVVQPEGLIWTVPNPAVQGTGMTGYQELIGNLYVLIGLLVLAAVGGWYLAVARGQRGRARRLAAPSEPA